MKKWTEEKQRIIPIRLYMLAVGLTIFNKIAIKGTPQMAVDKDARAYRESTHIVILSVGPYPALIINVTCLNLTLVYFDLEHINTTSMYTIS